MADKCPKCGEAKGTARFYPKIYIFTTEFISDYKIAERVFVCRKCLMIDTPEEKKKVEIVRGEFQKAIEELNEKTMNYVQIDRMIEYVCVLEAEVSHWTDRICEKEKQIANHINYIDIMAKSQLDIILQLSKAETQLAQLRDTIKNPITQREHYLLVEALRIFQTKLSYAGIDDIKRESEVLFRKFDIMSGAFNQSQQIIGARLKVTHNIDGIVKIERDLKDYDAAIKHLTKVLPDDDSGLPDIDEADDDDMEDN